MLPFVQVFLSSLNPARRNIICLQIELIGLCRCLRIWLIEAARTFPTSVQFDGIDVSFDQCPPKEWLPDNISWINHDVLSEPPPSLLQKYDIVHVQLFITILRDGNPVPMLQNLMKMLSEYLHLGPRSFCLPHSDLLCISNAFKRESEICVFQTKRKTDSLKHF